MWTWRLRPRLSIHGRRHLLGADSLSLSLSLSLTRLALFALSTSGSLTDQPTNLPVDPLLLLLPPPTRTPTRRRSGQQRPDRAGRQGARSNGQGAASKENPKVRVFSRAIKREIIQLNERRAHESGRQAGAAEET